MRKLSAQEQIQARIRCNSSVCNCVCHTYRRRSSLTLYPITWMSVRLQVVHTFHGSSFCSSLDQAMALANCE